MSSNQEDTNHLILNLVKQVKSIAYQLSAIDASSGPLIREEFEYAGSQILTTTIPFSIVYSVEVRGVGALSQTQYTVSPPNTITILDTLQTDDFIVVLFSENGTSPLPTYTQAQIDLLLALKEDLANKQNSLAVDGFGIKYPTVDAANAAFLRNIKLFARTGITNKLDQFALSVFDINTAIIGQCDEVLFWDELFVPGAVPLDAIKTFPQINYPLSELVTATGGNVNIVPLTADGLYIRYLGYDKDGNVYSSPSNFVDSSSIAQLGFTTVVKTLGVVSFLGGTAPGARNVFSQPILSNLNDLDRITVNTTTDININFNTGSPSLKSNAGVITGISINWRSLSNPFNTSSIDKFNYLVDPVVDFISMDANFLQDTSAPTIHTLWTEIEELVAINQSFYNTTTQLRDTIDSGNFSIKRVLIGVRGGIFIQEGEHATSVCFADIDEAKANVYTLPFTNAIMPTDLAIEIARIIFQEGVTDFTDQTKFFIVGTLGNSITGGGITPVGDATTISKGILKLAGDLAGTADLPTVPGLVLKEDSANKTNTIIGNELSTTLFATIKGWTDYFKQGLIALFLSKTTLVDADKLILEDSEDFAKTKSITWANVLIAVQNFLFGKFDSTDQIEVSTSQNVQLAWNGKLILFTSSVTITVPASLPANFSFQGGTLGGVTVIWATTAPKTFLFGAPTNTGEKSTIFLAQRGATNSIIFYQ